MFLFGYFAIFWVSSLDYSDLQYPCKRLTASLVSEMNYSVLMGTLNPILAYCVMMHECDKLIEGYTDKTDRKTITNLLHM